jgi:hypothetical protein
LHRGVKLLSCIMCSSQKSETLRSQAVLQNPQPSRLCPAGAHGRGPLAHVTHQGEPRCLKVPHPCHHLLQVTARLGLRHPLGPHGQTDHAHGRRPSPEPPGKAPLPRHCRLFHAPAKLLQPRPYMSSLPGWRFPSSQPPCRSLVEENKIAAMVPTCYPLREH